MTKWQLNKKSRTGIMFFRAQDRKIDAGQEVMLREDPKWVKGVVLRKVGVVMFEVRVGDGIWRRNANQLLKYQSQPEELESRVSPKLESVRMMK